jgi:hypothetical protein
LAIKIISVVVLMVDLDHVVHLVVVDLSRVVVELVHHQAVVMKVLVEVHLLLDLAILMLTFNLFQICRQYHQELVHLLFLLKDLFGSFISNIFLLFSRHRYSSKSANKQRYFDINIA